MIVTVFYDSGDTSGLIASLDSFRVQNAVALDRFKIIIHLQSPDAETIEIIRDRYPNTLITTTKRSVCLSCIFKRHHVRYGLVIPPNYISTNSLWPYLEEMRHILRTYAVSHIKLVPDTDMRNITTKHPLVYHYATSHILVGNGNLSRNIPALVRTSAIKPSDPCGALKVVVFSKDPY
jgi:hypothetical protein